MAALLFMLCLVSTDIPALIPMPREVSFTGEWVTFDRNEADGELLIEIASTIGAIENPLDSDEAYRLTIDGGGVAIVAPSEAGLFYGMQTLKQLIGVRDGKLSLPACTITDWPAFKIRGVMHDVGRNFQSIEFLKQQMDVLASYKLNTFHFHLTDHPGWRVESKAYPQLNKPENYRQTRKPGKFYTVEELRDFVEYCKERHITVIPEMDMPGHSEYFPKTFGFDMQTPEGVEVLKSQIGEWCQIFDAPLFHIGSDEVRIRMDDFIPQLVAEVRKHGREAVVWRPGGPLPDNGVVTQLWSRRPEPAEGVRFIDSRANYVNHLDPLAGVIRMFFQQPCRRPHGDEQALGGVLCYWPDTRVKDEETGLRISPFYPCVVAFSESLWRGKENDHPDCWAKLPPPETSQLNEFTAFENRLIEHRDRFFSDKPFPYVRQSSIPWMLIGPFDHGDQLDRVFGPEQEIKDTYKVDGKTYVWHDEKALGGTIHVNHFFGFPGHLPPAESGTVYALTCIHADQEMDAHMWINFNTLSLSGGRRGSGNPPAGEWSAVGSNIWINGQRIDPPDWDNPELIGKGTPEVAITDETYINRPPTAVHFKKGANEILVKAPHGKWKGRKSWKWCFTAVPVTWDGKRATELEGITFSTKP